MEESAIARLCRMLSSILTVFSSKQLEDPIQTPTVIRRPSDSVYIDEKHQIEKNNMEKNAGDKDPE
jgi:hypothetical protein